MGGGGGGGGRRAGRWAAGLALLAALGAPGPAAGEKTAQANSAHKIAVALDDPDVTRIEVTSDFTMDSSYKYTITRGIEIVGTCGGGCMITSDASYVPQGGPRKCFENYPPGSYKHPAFIINVPEGTKVLIENLGLRCFADTTGGSLQVMSGVPTVRSVTFKESRSGNYGGAIFVGRGAGLTLQDSKFQGNSATGSSCADVFIQGDDGETEEGYMYDCGGNTGWAKWPWAPVCGRNRIRLCPPPPPPPAPPPAAFAAAARPPAASSTFAAAARPPALSALSA